MSPPVLWAATSSSGSPSTSAPAIRWRPTAPSPTSPPPAPRSGRASSHPSGPRRTSQPTILGLPPTAVKVHVTQGGGSFGRHLFADAAFEAAAISKAMGKPVKLMWHRTDNFRQGRVHPMCTSRVRITYSGTNVISFEQRHTSVATDFTHGLGRAAQRQLRPAPRAGFPRLLAECLQPHRERPLQLRRGRPGAERGLQLQHVQHLERAQHLQPRGVRGHRADGRPAGRQARPGPVQASPRVPA